MMSGTSYRNVFQANFFAAKAKAKAKTSALLGQKDWD